MPQEPTLYEAMYIADPALTEEQMGTVIEHLRSIVVGAGGEYLADVEFGRRRLAYLIDDHRDGLYRVMYFRGSGGLVEELKQEFALTEGVIRGMVVADPMIILQAARDAHQAAEAREAETDAEASAPEAEEQQLEEQQPEEPQEQPAEPVAEQ